MSRTIRAAVYREPRAGIVIEDLIIDEPQEGEVLVAVTAVGVCHTDMVMRDGHLPLPFPVVLGHEGSGVVTEVGQGVTSVVPGDRVVLSFDSCGHCPSCDENEPAYCHSWFPLNFGGSRMDGSTALADRDGNPVHSHIFGQSSFASFAIVHARNVVKVGDDVPLELLGPLGCGIQTGAGTVLNVLKPRAGSSLAVIGTGAVGLSAIMAAKIAGATTIVALDINPQRVSLALQLGATHGFDARSGTVAEHANAAGCATGFDYIIDTTGIPSICSNAILALGPRGELALVGAYPTGANVEAEASHLMSGGRVIRGVVEGGADPQTFIPELVQLYKEGRFPFDKLVQFFDFERIAEAIEAGESGRVIKPIVRLIR